MPAPTPTATPADPADFDGFLALFVYDDRHMAPADPRPFVYRYVRRPKPVALDESDVNVCEGCNRSDYSTCSPADRRMPYYVGIPLHAQGDPGYEPDLVTCHECMLGQWRTRVADDHPVTNDPGTWWMYDPHPLVHRAAEAGRLRS